MKTQGETENPGKSDEEVEKEFPTFMNQLKWTLITDKIVQENNIQVNPDEIKAFCKAAIIRLYGRYGCWMRGPTLGK